ncbi:MAG TPA: hypothetical protein VIN59_05025 [Alphaproteobacteria bacterium]
MAIQGVPTTTEYAASLTKRERSFAELYRQARQAQVNDNQGQSEAEALESETETRRNRDYIAGLHDRVDTLRGEILARVISAGAPSDESRQNLGQDVSRLNARLETLRSKLHQEEERLSGHLLDINV